MINFSDICRHQKEKGNKLFNVREEYGTDHYSLGNYANI
jgi:hypothetical protein